MHLLVHFIDPILIYATALQAQYFNHNGGTKMAETKMTLDPKACDLQAPANERFIWTQRLNFKIWDTVPVHQTVVLLTIC